MNLLPDFVSRGTFVTGFGENEQYAIINFIVRIFWKLFTRG